MTRFLRPASTLVILAVLLQSCATPYIGRHPDLTKRGEAAEKEYAEFELEDSFFGAGQFMKMGPTREGYTINSMKPIVSEVSPGAFNRVRLAESGFAAQTLTLWIGILSGIVSVIGNKNDWGSASTFRTIMYAGFGTSIASGFFATWQMSAAASQYNDDLRTRLGLPPLASLPPSPGVQLGVKLSF